MTGMSGNRAFMDGQKPIDEMSLLELIELLHKIADEIMLREMEKAE